MQRIVRYDSDARRIAFAKAVCGRCDLRRHAVRADDHIGLKALVNIQQALPGKGRKIEEMYSLKALTSNRIRSIIQNRF
jgi:hypothetical protein